MVDNVLSVVYSLIIMLMIASSSNAYRSNLFTKPFTKSFELRAKNIYKVVLQRDGKDLAVLQVPEDRTVLDVAIDAGVDIPYDCKLGVCLTCPSQVLSGKSAQDIDPASTLDESVIEQGFALTCCLYAKSDMVVDIIDEDKLINAQFVKGAKTTY